MSRPSSPRVTLAVALLAAASLGSAENYTAAIYGVPAGWDNMISVGNGDGAMMSGYVFDEGGEHQAAYRTASGFRLMHPPAADRSEILDSWGSTYHCGYGEFTPGSSTFAYALFWVGGGEAVNLHPSGTTHSSSYALGGNGNIQAGFAYGTYNCPECGHAPLYHASTWSRTAASFRRLHSTTHTNTRGVATNGTQVVGDGFHRTDGSRNALLWKTIGGYSTNIRPSMSTESSALSVWGNQQGGYFISPATGGARHAVIWAGTAASAVDLNPSATFVASEVLAVRNGLQVGYAQPVPNPSRRQAIAWHGNAATWINLHSRLPYPYNTWNSRAEGIDNLGNVVGYIYRPGLPGTRPVVWVRS